MRFRRPVLPNNNETNFKKHCFQSEEDDKSGGSQGNVNTLIINKRYLKKDDDLEHNFDNNIVSNTVLITTVHYEIFEKQKTGGSDKDADPK